jgi:hypothetical protein
MGSAVPLGYLPAAQIDQPRRLIGEWLHLIQCRKEAVGTFFPVRPRIAMRGEPLRDQCINKHPDIVSRVLGYAVRMVAELLKEVIHGVLPVKELPQINAGGVEAKTGETMTGIGVEENGPVVKLLPEHDVRVGYGFVTVLDGGILSSVCYAIRVPGKRGYFRSIRTLRIVYLRFKGSHKKDALFSYNRPQLPGLMFYLLRK